MENEKIQSENLIRNEAYTDIDAVHPRFNPEAPEVVEECERETYYYCKQCNLYFAPTFLGLKAHFTKEIRKHKPCGSCFYCKGKVYEYSLKKESFVYHNCSDKVRSSINACNST